MCCDATAEERKTNPCWENDGDFQEKNPESKQRAGVEGLGSTAPVGQVGL